MNLSGFDLNLLRVLDALLAESSTVKAGARIGLSQPAVSAALGRLRASLGDELFVRRGAGMEPTDFARSLALPLRDALDRLEALLDPPQDFDPAVATTRFRILGSDYYAELLLPVLARRFASRSPGLTFQLLGLGPQDPFAMLLERQADMVLLPDDAVPDWAGSEIVMQSEFSVIARSGHPRLKRAGLMPGDEIPLDLYCDLGHAVFSSEGSMHTMGDAALARVGRKRRIAMTLPVFSGVCAVVAGSDLIGLVPSPLARHVCGRHGLSLYRAPMQVPPARIAAIWHRRSAGNPAFHWLRAQIALILGQDGAIPGPDQGAPAITPA